MLYFKGMESAKWIQKGYYSWGCTTTTHSYQQDVYGKKSPQCKIYLKDSTGDWLLKGENGHTVGVSNAPSSILKFLSRQPD